ncbi:hypothetical protein WJX74_004739 [Apatococcus lobatus]|uniref:Uncharacterized protein n=1 Tax=Apatococcus lobatus TaxID=904363 RepID=A0AAW1RBN6_9CHLO
MDEERVGQIELGIPVAQAAIHYLGLKNRWRKQAIGKSTYLSKHLQQTVPAGSRAEEGEPAESMDAKVILEARRRIVGPNVTLLFDEPIHMVRGEGVHLYDADGNEYLDTVNNVAHVGHCHPKVTAAVTKALMTLNTNSRYLHQDVIRHAQLLLPTLPSSLEAVYWTSSGSEATELAVRIARAACPGALHVAVMDYAYHGHTCLANDLSPLKFNGPGGSGQPSFVHVLPCPDIYRQTNLDGRAAARKVIAEAHAAGARIGAFIAEPILSCGGQVVLPNGYLAAVYEEMRAEGAACIADEIQTGFGRVGRTFWAFQLHGVVPDIVTLGKPIGNGFPMGAVVVSRRLAKAFSNGTAYFATFGGCTAAGAAGVAVMEALQEEQLQGNAAVVGAYFKEQLQIMQQEFEVIGDVRGEGLMLGIELVDSKASKAPATLLANRVKEAAKCRERLLIAIEGPHSNVIKIKPPIVFSLKDVDKYLAALRKVLEEEQPLCPK